LKGTAAVLALSIFLEINPSTFRNYLIFLGIYYLLLFMYMLFKRSTEYRITETGISIRRLRRQEISANYENFENLSYAQGFLARRFRCGTIYVELKKGKGTHTATTGKSLYILRDVPNPIDLYSELLSRVGTYVPSNLGTGSDAPPAPSPG